MDFIECVKERRSVRKFKNIKVEHEKFETIIKLASFSPSWKNSQITGYCIVEDNDVKNNIADNCTLGCEHNSGIIKNAPAIIVVTMESFISGYEKDGSFTTSKGDRWEMFDAGISTQTLCLAAHSEGLGSVVLGIIDEEEIIKAINLPKNKKVAALVAIGYPDEEPVMPKRKDIDKLLTYI